MLDKRDFGNTVIRAMLNDRQVEAAALISCRAVYARSGRPDEGFEGHWRQVREDEIFRVSMAILAVHAVLRDGLEAI